MRKIILATAAALVLGAALPASASAWHPTVCDVVNPVTKKVTGEEYLICIDDPHPDPIAITPASASRDAWPPCEIANYIAEKVTGGPILLC